MLVGSRKETLLTYANRPWQCLYFLPEPQGQASLRPTLPQLEGSSGLRSGAAAPAVIPWRARVSAPARARASSSSPVEGSILCASMYGKLAGSSGGGAALISTRISCEETASRRLALMASNRLNDSALYSLSGSRWP